MAVLAELKLDIQPRHIAVLVFSSHADNTRKDDVLRPVACILDNPFDVIEFWTKVQCLLWDPLDDKGVAVPLAVIHQRTLPPEFRNLRPASDGLIVDPGRGVGGIESGHRTH